MSDTTSHEKDKMIDFLKKEVAHLKRMVHWGTNNQTTYYASENCSMTSSCYWDNGIPEMGMPAGHIKEMIEQTHLTDFNPRLNTSSYVNVVSEKEERDVAIMGAQVNIADGSVYPSSIKIHNETVNMIAHLWHAPPPSVIGGDYCGAGTVGSTEACLLAALALKFRWRNWYAKKHGLTTAEVQAIRPNLVINSCYQAAWEKVFRYFDVDPKFAKPSLLKDFSAVDPETIVSLCDEKTIGVVAILGNHYNGVYDPVWAIDPLLQKLNLENDWQIGIHVDAASGGFIAPFQELNGRGPPGPYDFRLPNVLSISASGHKFGESICGTGWVVWRQREDLAEHIAISVTYLGGHSDSYTLNFSRPASGPYVQFYKFMRLGKEGYKAKVKNQMAVAKYLRDFLKSLKYTNGKPRFIILDGGDTCTLPVVAARLNPELNLLYDDIDLQHALSESHWYVSGYTLGFEDPSDPHAGTQDLFTDVQALETMFRIVVKSNLTLSLAQNLCECMVSTLAILDSLEHGYRSTHHAKADVRVTVQKIQEEDEVGAMDPETAMIAALAINKWSGSHSHLSRSLGGESRGSTRQIASGVFPSNHAC